ncbi:MAG: hypothetical protein J6M34_07025 [Clostridia bacterium]|nr:hypothetical protein [Clostridia bacterium]
MFLCKRNNHKKAACIGTSVAVLVAAHVAVGYLLYKGIPRRSKFGRMVKKAKRTASGLVREIF